MLRGLSLSTALLTTSLVLLGCPPEQTGDAGTVVDAGDEEEDAGQVDSGPQDQGCGDLTLQGECVGSVVTFCDTNTDTIIEYDCADRSQFPDATTECSLVNAEWGVDCTVAPSGTCAYFTDEGFEADLCRGTEPGCLESNETFACVENVGTCAEEDVGTCDGDTLTWACNASQPQLTDCASYGGTCDADDEACVGLPVGSLCDDALLVCADGLDCQVGECVALTPADAGTPDAGADDDAGAGDDDDAGAVDAG